MPDVFSVPIFFVVFRETLEAAIIISVLLALVQQLVHSKSSSSSPSATVVAEDSTVTHSQFTDLNGEVTQSAGTPLLDDREVTQRRLLRKLRIQIFAGAATGLLLALIIGAAFIAIYYTKVVDLYGNSEELWEGIFSLIAAVMIWIMGLTMLRIDRAKIKWRIKLQKAFERNDDIQNIGSSDSRVKQSRSGKWALFLLPGITVLREGLEAVVFVGGVSLGQPGTSIPLAAIVGLLVGLAVGFLLYKSSSRLNISIFLVASTALLLLIGAGLLSKAVGNFEMYKFIQLVGADVAETGDGPGSYSVHGNIWHLDCCNPENRTASYGWSIFNAILGWTNNGSVGTVLSYIFYWLSVVAALVYMKWEEGRVSLFGHRSQAWHRRQDQQNARLRSQLSAARAAQDKDERHSPSSSVSGDRSGKGKDALQDISSSDRNATEEVTETDSSSMLPQVYGGYPSINRPELHNGLTEVSFK